MTLQKDAIHYPAIHYDIFLFFNPNSVQRLNSFLLKIKHIHLNTMPLEFKVTVISQNLAFFIYLFKHYMF